MAILGLLFVALNFFVVFVLFYNYNYKRRKFPPGPAPLPLLGNIIDLYKNPPGDELFIKWRKQYGDVYTIWISEQPVIIVTGYEKLVETFQKDGDSYAGRFTFEKVDKLLRGDNLGVVFTEGDLWRDQRRFTLHVLRDFGLGKNVMQEKILHELESRFQELNNEIKEAKGEYPITDMINLTVGSIINYIMFSYRFQGENISEFFDLKKIMTSLTTSPANHILPLISLNPDLLKNWPIFKQCLRTVQYNFESLFCFFRRHIEKQIKNMDFENFDETPKDYVEAYLREQYKREQAGDYDHYYTIDQLVNMCFDIWFAGQETTSVTLCRGLAYILHNLDVQEKMQQELDSVIGNPSQQVTMADKSKLPYTCAETQRITNLLPMNLFHKTTRDVVINGFKIAKDSCIIPQISTVLYDEELYPEPKKFMPERFITEDGKLKRSDELIPFSLGKRQCLGEGLARMELFLIFANFFNQYKIFPAKNLPDLTRRSGAVVSCPDFTCHIEKRQ